MNCVSMGIYLGIAHQIQFDGQFEEQQRVLEHMLIETSDGRFEGRYVRVNLSGGILYAPHPGIDYQLGSCL